MPLLNATFYEYWPAVILLGAVLIVTFIIVIFWYIDHKDLQKQKALEEALLLQSILVPIEPRKNFWQRFKQWLGISKKDQNEEVDEYKDRYGSFQTIALLLTIGGIIYLITQIDFSITFPKTSLPSWLRDLFSNILFWIGLAVVILLFIFRKKVLPKFNWKWLWIIPVLILAYWIYYEWQDYKIKKLSWKPNVVINNSNRVDPLIGSPYLDMNGKNFMQKGEFFQFDVNWDDPSVSFDPETSEKVVLYFQKAEDPTRRWRLVLWKNKQGKKEYLFYPSTPIAEALIGKVYVKSEISSVNVVVSRK